MIGVATDEAREIWKASAQRLRPALLDHAVLVAKRDRVHVFGGQVKMVVALMSEGREHWTYEGDVRLFLWEKAAGCT